jgi:hypothetical protein
MRDRQAVCSFRVSFAKGSVAAKEATPEKIVEQGMADVGRDMFCFRPAWLRRWLPMLPDYVMAYSDWDSTLAMLIRFAAGLHSTEANWVKPLKGSEMESGYVFHEYHDAEWNKDRNRDTQFGNAYNRELTKKFIAQNKFCWFT